MRIYGFDWAASVVDKYMGSTQDDPRVRDALCYWRDQLQSYYGANGHEILRGRLIYHLRRAKISNAWEICKRGAKNKLDWDAVYEGYLKAYPKQSYSTPIEKVKKSSESIKNDIYKQGELFEN